MSSNPIPVRPQQSITSTDVIPESSTKTGPDLLMEGEVLWDKYKLPIVALCLLAVVGLVGSEVYRSNRNKNLAAASAELAAAKSIDDYKKVIEAHGDNLAAAGAYLLMGRLQLNSKDYAGASETWKTFADKFPQHPLAPNALMGAASALESQTKFDQAQALYKRVESGYTTSYIAPLASLAEATLLKSQGKMDDARHIYENIIASAPQSDAARQATESLRLLKAVPSLPADTKPQPLSEAAPQTPAAPVSVPSAAVPASPASDAVTPPVPSIPSSIAPAAPSNETPAAAVQVPASIAPSPAATATPAAEVVTPVAPAPQAVVPVVPNAEGAAAPAGSPAASEVKSPASNPSPSLDATPAASVGASPTP